MARRPRKQLTLAQKRANPATRSKLPTSQLTATQQAQRRSNQRIARENANPLYDPTQVLTGHNLASAARQIAGTELDPQISALTRQSANTQTQQEGLQGKAAGYYKALAQGEADRHAKMQALADLTSKSVAGVGAQTRQDFNTQQAAADAARTADIGQRGQGLQGGDQAGAEAAAARQRAGALQGAAETAAAQQGANYTSLSDLVGQAIQLRGAETQGRLRTGEANALNELAGKVADLRGQKGGLEAKTLTDLREKGFEDIATMKGLGLKADALTNTANIAAANRSVKREGIRATQETAKQNRLAAQARQGAQLSQSERNSLRSSGINPDTGKPIPGGKLDPNRPTKQTNESAASLKMRRDIATARGTWRRLMAKFKGDERHVKAHMIETMGVPPEAYNAIYDLERFHGLNPANVRGLEGLGVTVPDDWKHPRRKPSPGRGAPANP